jgi:5-methyltetrahydropteroyltriglutamate--homocysteine methyltransferase
VAEVVRRQVEAGVDVPSDGEFGKVGWTMYALERFAGLEPKQVPLGTAPLYRGKDRQDFAEFYSVWTPLERTLWLPPAAAQAGSEAPPNLRWVCTGPISYQGQSAIHRDIENFKAALAGVQVEEAFMPVAAPGSVEASHPNEYFPTDEAYVQALADALKQEYRAIVDAGLLLQVDDAFLPYVYDWMVDRASMEEYLKFSEMRVEALNYALEGIPPDRVRYHICWGSWNGPHSTDVPLREIIQLVLKVRASAYSIEAANPRHEHEWRLWEGIKLPDGKLLIPGVVTHSTNIIEHPELVAERIERLAGLVGRENVIAGTDCGFSQNWNLIRVHPSIQWAKLRALAEGAELATRRLWQR